MVSWTFSVGNVFPKRGSCFESRSEFVIEEMGMCCCNKDGQTKSHEKNLVLTVFRGLKREIDLVRANGSREFQNVFDSISVEFDQDRRDKPRQMQIEADPRHREILHARMNMKGFDICVDPCCICETQTDTPKISMVPSGLGNLSDTRTWRSWSSSMSTS